MVSCGTTPGNLVLTINQKIDENRLRPSMEVYLKIDHSKKLTYGTPAEGRITNILIVTFIF